MSKFAYINTINKNGYSLIELMIVISIMGISLTFAVSNFNQSFMREERTLTLDRLKTAIEYAKLEAFIRGKTITLCGSTDNKTCSSKDWSKGYIIFENPEQEIHPKFEQILQVFSGLHFGRLYFESFGPQNLNIFANGTTINLGAFTYCPKNRDNREAEALIINQACRTYRPTEKNILNVFIKHPNSPHAIPLSCR